MKRYGYRNSEGYFDPTVGKAMQRMEATVDFKAGDIIRFTTYSDREKFFAVIGCTTSVMTGCELRDVQYDEAIMISCDGEKYAQPERLEYIYAPKATNADIVRTMTDEEMTRIKTAIANYLGIKTEEPKENKPLSVPVEVLQKVQPVAVLPGETVSMKIHQSVCIELAKAQTKAEIYHDLYMNLMEKTTRSA